eukprot:Rmarinus@m.25056
MEAGALGVKLGAVADILLDTVAAAVLTDVLGTEARGFGGLLAVLEPSGVLIQLGGLAASHLLHALGALVRHHPRSLVAIEHAGVVAGVPLARGGVGRHIKLHNVRTAGVLGPLTVVVATGGVVVSEAPVEVNTLAFLHDHVLRDEVVLHSRISLHNVATLPTDTKNVDLLAVARVLPGGAFVVPGELLDFEDVGPVLESTACLVGVDSHAEDALLILKHLLGFLHAILAIDLALVVLILGHEQRAERILLNGRVDFIATGKVDTIAVLIEADAVGSIVELPEGVNAKRLRSLGKSNVARSHVVAHAKDAVRAGEVRDCDVVHLGIPSAGVTQVVVTSPFELLAF